MPKTGGAAGAKFGVRTDRHRSVRRQSLLGHHSTPTAEGITGRHPDSADSREPRPDPARLHLLPTLWFRNTWSWGAAYDEGRWPKPSLTRADDRSLVAVHATLGRFRLTAGNRPDGRRPSSCSPRTRTTRSGCSAHQMKVPTSRTLFTTSLSTVGTTRFGTIRDEGGGDVCFDLAGGAECASTCG